ncbi:glycerophosphodiester phosphodiesterase [Pseudopedobacter beijingensis]|uniref:Glycerophosphodiester phosphodiesterase n=1 Tax=Pseudopedobacter beijingensis TaxID=1207056 RepID=A0ABW4IEN2_9SPHI
MIKKAFLFFALGLLGSNMSYSQNNPIIAHRGAWKNNNVPQNSRASLKKAIELKCYGSEFDVHITKDDVLVINHDNDFLGKDIATATFKELRKLKMANGERIPTVEEFIKIAKSKKNAHHTKLIYEIKSSGLGKERTKDNVRKSLELVKKHHVEDLVEFILFDYDAAKEIIALKPDAKVQSLSAVDPEKAKKDKLTGLDFHMSVYDKNQNYISLAKSLGLTTNVWTVNKEEDIKRFLQKEVNYITTDEPERALKLYAETNKK